MCERCVKKRDAMVEALGEKLGVVAESVSEEEHSHSKDELTAMVELKTSPSGAEKIKDFTILISNVVEDAGTGVAMAVIIAVNPEFVKQAETGSCESAPLLMMSAVALKDAMEPLARALRAASGKEERDRGEETPRGDVGSKLN